MNTIAANFNYISNPWWNFDLGEAVQFYWPISIEKYLRRAHGKSVKNIFKSHHALGFFEEIMDYIAGQFHIFYIYRDPRDVLVSNWKLIRSLGWDEGPKPETASLFLRAEPRGGMLRYQKRQERNMLTRWWTHVQQWTELAKSRPDYGICVLSYEELNLDFETAVRKIGRALNQSPEAVRRPDVDENVVGSGNGKVGNYLEYLNDEDLAFVTDEIGEALERFNYSA